MFSKRFRIPRFLNHGLILVTFLINGCTQNSQPVEPKSAVLEEQLKQDRDVKALIDIRDQITRRVLERSIDIKELGQAYEGSDFDKVVALMGFSPEELQSLARRLEAARESLWSKYPTLREQASTMGRPCSPGEMKKFFSAFEKYKARAAVKAFAKGNDAAVQGGCKWIAYTLCLIGCTSLGPIVYWPCAYFVCYCELCDEDVLGLCEEL